MPPVALVVSPGALRRAVDEELHGIFLAGIEVWRFDQEALDFVVVCALKPEGLQRRHRDIRESSIVQVSQALRWMSKLFGYAPLGTRFVDRGWKRDRHSGKDDGFSVRGYGYVVVEAITDRHGSVISSGFLSVA